MKPSLFVFLTLAAFPLASLADPPSEFTGFIKPREVQPRTGPLDRIEWERRTRSALSFAPQTLRAPDAALLDAARAGKWSEILEAIKSERVTPNITDEAGTSMLALAAADGQDDAVRELLRIGANPNRAGADGFTPLGAAAFYGHRSTVRQLIKAGADPVARGATGQTPLHLAAMNNRVGVIDELLRAGVNPRVVNREGDNALDVAANRGQQDAMSRLIEAGVDPQMSGR